MVRARATRVACAVMGLLGSLVLSSCAPQAQSQTAMIVGADAGMGLALTRHYAALGWTVIAVRTATNQANGLVALSQAHPNIVFEKINSAERTEITALAAKYEGQSLDLLINAENFDAGDQTPHPGAFSYDQFEALMHVNALGPLMVTQAFTPHLATSTHGKVITLTSHEASLAGVKDPARYFYRASKAAVNIIMVTLAPDLAEQQIIVGLIAVDTGVPVGGDETFSLKTRAINVAFVIDDYSLETSGAFYTWDGRELPW